MYTDDRNDAPTYHHRVRGRGRGRQVQLTLPRLKSVPVGGPADVIGSGGLRQSSVRIHTM